MFSNHLEVAQFLGPDTAPVLVCALLVLIPIVIVMVRHQYKMAELIHGNKNSADPNEIAMLRGEVYELRERLVQQSLLLESLRSQIKENGASNQPASSADISARLNS